MTVKGDPPLEAIRAFVALDLEPTSLRRLARTADRLRMGSGAPSATWTPPARMHVTLMFVAALPVRLVAPLGTALRPLAEGKSPPRACPIRLGAFPAVEQARIIIAELLDDGGSMAKLAEKVNRLAKKLGIAGKKQPFFPHVTLARLKRAYDARRWLRPELAEASGDCRTASLTLFRSELGADTSTYVPLVHVPFRAAEGPPP